MYITLNPWSINLGVFVKLFAVVGAFAIGLYLSGWLVQLVAKVSFGQSVPRYPLWVVRTLSGIVCGWIAIVLLFGVGEGGGGGGGGWSFFGGTGDGKGVHVSTENPSSRKKNSTKKDDPKKETKEEPAVPTTQTLRIEVLGRAPLEKLAGGGSVDETRCYRVQDIKQLHSLEELKKLIREKIQQMPPLRKLEIVAYRDSGVFQVTDLERWANEVQNSQGARLVISSIKPGTLAPVQ